MKYKEINLISDTVTKPSKEMLEFMMSAEVGDDVFSSDPSVNELQEKAAAIFGKEAGLFCPSGTMTNQIAIAGHTNRLDEVLCDRYSHVYLYETGGYASNSGVAIKLIPGLNGKITASQIEAVINPTYDWLPTSRLVVLENSSNKGGGSYYTNEEIKPIRDLCTEKGLALHLDGARIFNVLVETKEDPKELGALFDSISICISKGLGAPVGSVLLGDKEFIRRARRLRKAMGGGMRQAGYLAKACIYALENNVERLKEDNDRAKILGAHLEKLPYIGDIRPIKTNILIFDVLEPYTSASFIAQLASKGISSSPFGAHTVRFVTHLDFNEEMLQQVLDCLSEDLPKELS